MIHVCSLELPLLSAVRLYWALGHFSVSQKILAVLEAHAAKSGVYVCISQDTVGILLSFSHKTSWEFLSFYVHFFSSVSERGGGGEGQRASLLPYLFSHFCSYFQITACWGQNENG